MRWSLSSLSDRSHWLQAWICNGEKYPPTHHLLWRLHCSLDSSTLANRVPQSWGPSTSISTSTERGAVFDRVECGVRVLQPFLWRLTFCIWLSYLPYCFFIVLLSPMYTFVSFFFILPPMDLHYLVSGDNNLSYCIAFRDQINPSINLSFLSLTLTPSLILTPTSSLLSLTPLPSPHLHTPPTSFSLPPVSRLLPLFFAPHFPHTWSSWKHESFRIWSFKCCFLSWESISNFDARLATWVVNVIVIIIFIVKSFFLW